MSDGQEARATHGNVDQLERELDRSRRKYRQLFEAVPSHICVLDRELRIVESNALYKKDFRVASGTHCYEACKSRKSACPECLVAKTFLDGMARSSEETLNTADGRRRDMVVHSMPIRNRRNEITSVMEVFTDITEVKRLQRELALTGRAVAGMAHRVKNILMGLEGGIFVANTGREAEDPETIAQGWEMVERNVRTISRVVRDLLYCSKERAPEFVDGVSPPQILRQVGELYARCTANEGIELVIEADPAVKPGRFDPEGIQNMLCNLVANAIDACRFDPDETSTSHRIVVRCTGDEHGATVFEVEDDGPGMPEDVIGKVFTDFFSTKGTEGTGVGLLVVQKVAKEHGGRVTFTTEEGRGTAFRVVIPPNGVQLAPSDQV